MAIDERGFDSETRNYLELTFEELQEAYKKLALQFSIQSTVNRNLNIEFSQLKMYAGADGITTTALQKIRKAVLSSYLNKLKPRKRGVGRPKLSRNQAIVAELWRLYAVREDRELGIKPWLRREIEGDYKENKLSLITHKTEIELMVQKFATQITRYSSALHNY